MPRPSLNGRRAGRKESFDHWVPHKGPFKVIKLPREAGVVPEMTQAEYEERS